MRPRQQKLKDWLLKLSVLELREYKMLRQLLPLKRRRKGWRRPKLKPFESSRRKRPPMLQQRL